jgi:hypothetical protein
MSVRHHSFDFDYNETPPILCQMSIPKTVFSEKYPSVHPTILRCFNNIVHPTYRTLSNGQK